MTSGIMDHYFDDHLCSVEATCANTFGSYNCTCNEGWRGDGFNCTDIDECLEEDPCDMNGWCNNTLGSFECYCNEGYYGDGFACADSDECGFADQGKCLESRPVGSGPGRNGPKFLRAENDSGPGRHGSKIFPGRAGPMTKKRL